MTTVVDPSLMCAPKQDQRNVGLCTAETLGYLSLRHGPAEFPDFSDFICGQEFLETGDTADVDSMLFIETIIRPFEIINESIRFDSIDMVDDREVVWIGNKCQRDKTMNEKVFRFSVSPQADLNVSEFVYTGSEYLSIAPLRSIRTRANSINASYPAKITDFVEVTELGDGDTPPFFGEHNMGPFARSAHVIASFRAHQGD